ncbi:MAG: hypothetical protein A4E73_00466 [Syntrophaceae bacterium PtaU1.Bin231]|nr:MAG: hypothetical protein A4E73_00466 [Syntrophaceae bacterium PtaU1.Bin231]
MLRGKNFFRTLAAAAGLLLVMAGFSPLESAESDLSRLINLLKSKNILTQQEADSLLTELNAAKQKEREEMKTEVREEVKAAAGKGELLPPALKGFKFGTTIYGEWNNRTTDNAGSTNAFNLNRAYLTLTKDVNEWLAMNVTADLFTSVDPDDNRNGLELRLKYAYANLNFFGTNTQLGMIPTPSDSYDSAIWPYRAQGPNFFDGQGILSTSDLGVSIQGHIGGTMDESYLKYASRQFAGKWGGYFVGVYNGPGYTNTENNHNKVVSGLVYVRPFPSLPVLQGLQLAYTGSYGKSNSNFAPGSGVVTDYPDFRAHIAQASLQHGYFTVMGQYYWGKGTATSTEENDRKGYLVDAFLRIPTMEKLRLFGKYYFYDPNTDRSLGYKTYVAGLSYDVAPEFMPFIAFEQRIFDSAAGGNNYDKYQVGFQLKF